MPTFERCNESVKAMARAVLKEFDTHKPLVDFGVQIDLVFAHANLDPLGMPVGPALRHGGVPALGIARILPLKQRVLGRGDAEISLDGDWWNDAGEEQQRALLDHELHHLSIKYDKHGGVSRDAIDRPRLVMRKHDYQFGWFSIIAARHGKFSQECIQAKHMVDGAGSFLFPAEVMAALRNK